MEHRVHMASERCPASRPSELYRASGAVFGSNTRVWRVFTILRLSRTLSPEILTGEKKGKEGECSEWSLNARRMLRVAL